MNGIDRQLHDNVMTLGFGGVNGVAFGISANVSHRKELFRIFSHHFRTGI